jgi:transposase-like protein
MKQQDFNTLISQFDALSAKQRHSLLELLQHPEGIPDIVEHLEQRLHDHLECPECQNTKIHRWGMHKGIQRYRCCSCRKTFTALSNTPLSGLRMRERWMEYAEGMLHSEVLRKAAARCDIHLTTSFRWRHRFLKLADELNAEALEGIVEADQTLFRESFKGQRKITVRTPRKRGNDKKKEAHWISVLVARDRHKHEADFVLHNFTIDQVEEALLPRLSANIVLCTDGHVTFEAFTNEHKLTHKVLNASKGERVKEGAYHIQSVNSYHKRLKGWIARFHGVATKYLHRYLGWFRWFDQHRYSEYQLIDFMADFTTAEAFQHLNRT